MRAQSWIPKVFRSEAMDAPHSEKSFIGSEANRAATDGSLAMIEILTLPSAVGVK